MIKKERIAALETEVQALRGELQALKDGVLEINPHLRMPPQFSSPFDLSTVQCGVCGQKGFHTCIPRGTTSSTP